MKAPRPQPGALKAFERSEAITPGPEDFDYEDAPRGILLPAAGDVTGTLYDDSVERTYALPAGIHLLSFRAVSASTVDLIALF